MYQVEDIIIQRIMHSSVKMKLQFFLQLCYYFLLHKCMLISLCALLPDCAKLYIYRYIYERDIFSTTEDVFVLD